MLPVALRANREARLEDLARLAYLLRIKDRACTAEDAVDALIAHVESICDEVGVPRRLSDLGITADKIPALVAGSRGSSMSGNPRELSDEELTVILEGIL